MSPVATHTLTAEVTGGERQGKAPTECHRPHVKMKLCEPWMKCGLHCGSSGTSQCCHGHVSSSADCDAPSLTITATKKTVFSLCLACATTIIELRNSWPGVGLKARHLIFFFTSIYTQRVPDFKLGKKTQLLAGVFRLSCFAEQPSPTVKLVWAQCHIMCVDRWQPPVVWVLTLQEGKQHLRAPCDCEDVPRGCCDGFFHPWVLDLSPEQILWLWL